MFHRAWRGVVGWSDAALLEAANERPDAFAEFYERHRAVALRFFRQAGRSPEDAVELSAELFAQALASSASFDPARGDARAWLFGIARNLSARSFEQLYGTAQAHRRLAGEARGFEDSIEEWLTVAADVQLGTRAMALLGRLPVEQEEAVRRRVLEGASYSELASATACSQDVARQRVSRGLGTLRRLVLALGSAIVLGATKENLSQLFLIPQ